ncbi:Microtubule binding Kinesin motor domain [Trypanosoma vivax]|nr:Microtubule binding Kinesin motor domain [Trypanosoma vivax]
MMSSLSQPADGENAGLSAGTTETAVSHGDASHPQTAAMRVYVRIRPFARRELLRDGSQPQSTLKLDAKEGYLHVLDPSRNFLTRHTYGFEYCFNSGEAGLHGDQEAVYRHVGLPVLHNVIDGYNGCVFAYGQTGSGKTYTMLGVAHASLPEKSNGMERGHDYPKQCNTVRRKVHPELSARNASTRFVADDIFREVVVDDVCYVAASEGIIPRLARDIFKTLRQKQTDNSTHSFRVEMEFYEIYNEKAFDLLANGCGGTMAELRVRHQATTGAYVDGLSRKHVTCERDMLKWIKRGGVERHTAFTKANDRSSRSHAILTIHIVQVNIDQRDNSNRVSSKLNLVDLAGSERTGASGVEGLHFKEATMINLSLTALGRVIDTLADISSGKQGIFCPYRDSNLTWVLMDSLGGNSRTTMVATVSPYIDHYDETCQTLRYASRAKQIVNTAVVNEDPQVRQIKMLTAEVARLKGLVGNNAACDFTNEEVDRLRHRVIELEQQLVERNLMLETLQSQAVDRRAFSKKQTACTVSSKSKAADDKMVLDSSEKDLGNTARRTSVSCSLMSQSIDSLPTRDGRPECHMPRRYLSNRTLQELKRLGISAEEDCIKLLESVTHCAYEATMNYESMCKKNTMMINSHSHALRENLHKIEAKEWSVLTSIGEKLIASMEEACKRHETSIRSCEKMCRSMSHGTFSVTPLSSLEGYNADDKRCFVCKAATPNKFMMKEEKENQKIEEKMRRQVSTGVADCDKIKRRAELSHKNVCGAQAKNEKTRKSGAVALTSVSRDTERSLELQKQYYAMRLRSFSKLAADNVEKFLKLYSKENCEWSCIMMRHYEEWNALQCRNARQGKSVDQRVKDGVKVLLPPEVSKLHQSIAGLAQCGCEATYSTGPVYNSQPNVLLCSFMQKIDVLRDSYESQICDLKERCLELAGAFAPTETKTQNEIENSSQKPHEEVVHTIESLKCQQKNCIKGTEEAKMPNGCTVEGQKNEGWKDIKLMGQDLMRYTAHVELQQHEAIKLGVIKGLVVLECVQGHYGQHVKQCSAQMDNVLQACSTKTNIVQQHYEQFVQKVLEEREKEREQVAATKQNKEELHLLRKECEYVKKQKEIACSLLSGVGTLMAAGDALRAEHMDAVLSTVGAAVTELAHQREEHVAAVDVLEREVVSARTAMEQQRAEFEKRALDLRTAHEREWLELADSSSLLVAECVSWRQAVARRRLSRAWTLLSTSSSLQCRVPAVSMRSVSCLRATWRSGSTVRASTRRGWMMPVRYCWKPLGPVGAAQWSMRGCSLPTARSARRRRVPCCWNAKWSTVRF